jgi:glycosyltransferase involved in cell wall biosynthesis
VKLISVELSRPLPSVPPSSVGEQRVLVRLHGEPLGFLTTAREGLRPQQLGRLILERFPYEIARHLVADGMRTTPATITELSQVPAACPHDANPSVPVTVAVCTRNRAEELRKCLDALVSLDYPASQLELLIVDNAPLDASTRDVVSTYPRVRYVCEPAPGLDNARNRAIRESSAPIIAMTDDDARVDPLWVRGVAAAFEEEPRAMCVTGLVVPDELDTPAQMMFESYGGFGRGVNRTVFLAEDRDHVAARYAGAGRFGTGANMAFRREFFERHGGFDPALDVGTPTNGGGDLEMFFRVLKEGHALVYEPRAIVRHRHRRDYRELRIQIENNGIGFYSYVARTAAAYPGERAALTRFGAWWWWSWNVRRLLRSLAGREAIPRDLIVAECIGSLKGLSRYRASQRWRAALTP